MRDVWDCIKPVVRYQGSPKGSCDMSESPPLSLSQSVYQVLKNEILECRMAPNSDLREQSLAQRFEMSKSPVREALLRLEQDRLVTVAPRQGYRVTPLSIEDAREMFGLRRVLEGACAEAAAELGSASELKELDVFRTLNKARGEDRTDAFIKYNRSFHSAVCVRSGNSRLARLAVDLVEQMERLIRFDVSSVSREAEEALLREHGEIIDAIQARDRRRAAKLVKQHILEAEKRVVRSLSFAAIRV
jgi:GntR family transcriptional regulator, rspAB operon transcriptional repressor